MKHYGGDHVSPELLQEAIDTLTVQFDQKLQDANAFTSRLDIASAGYHEVLSKRIQSLQLALVSVFSLNIAMAGLVIYLFLK